MLVHVNKMSIQQILFLFALKIADMRDKFRDGSVGQYLILGIGTN